MALARSKVERLVTQTSTPAIAAPKIAGTGGLDSKNKGER